MWIVWFEEQEQCQLGLFVWPSNPALRFLDFDFWIVAQHVLQKYKDYIFSRGTQSAKYAELFWLQPIGICISRQTPPEFLLWATCTYFFVVIRYFQTNCSLVD